jgi:putative nucleotidyltransferase with HDIG domain
MASEITRDEALNVLNEYVKGESLIRHSLTVEAVMKHFAELFKADDAEKWGVIGLIHDIDFELYPEQHCAKTREILEAHNFPEDYIRAAESHGWGLVNDIKPEKDFEKVLYTVDELTGLIAATAIMRPSKSVLDIEVKSVKKKWKQKGFAIAINRDVIQNGVELLGLELDYVIEQTIKGMRNISDIIDRLE